MACCQIWQITDVLAPAPPRRQTLHTNPSAAIMKMDWPILVFDSGFSEGLDRLRVDARWWLVNSRGDVNIVIIISIKSAEKSLRIEKWCLALPGASLPVTRAHPNPNRLVPTKMQEICVTQNPANPVHPVTTAPCTVTGGYLVLEF